MDENVLRKFICLKVPSNKDDVYKVGKYTFKYNKQLQPIPVEVPENIALILLQMMDRSCRCHYRPPQPMFKELYN